MKSCVSCRFFDTPIFTLPLTGQVSNAAVADLHEQPQQGRCSSTSQRKQRNVVHDVCVYACCRWAGWAIAWRGQGLEGLAGVNQSAEPPRQTRELFLPGESGQATDGVPLHVFLRAAICRIRCLTQRSNETRDSSASRSRRVLVTCATLPRSTLGLVRGPPSHGNNVLCFLHRVQTPDRSFQAESRKTFTLSSEH